MKYAFAGDRQIGVTILQFLMAEGYSPEALLVSGKEKASHANELVDIASLHNSVVFYGNDFKKPKAIDKLRSLEVDYIFGIHFPYLVPPEVLSIPKVGFLNLHPAYLPYHKGWHTPSWAILNDELYGATLHFMTDALDGGDIIHQKEIQISPVDTAHSLYQKVLSLEVKVFKEAFPQLLSLSPQRIPQTHSGSSHRKADLKKLRKIDLEMVISGQAFIDQLRALQTNKKSELPYIEIEGKRYGIEMRFIPLDS